MPTLTPNQQAIKELQRIIKLLRADDNEATIESEYQSDSITIEIDTPDGDYERTQIKIQNIA